jgi:2-oxoisovalerate dehydrogenase E1 component
MQVMEKSSEIVPRPLVMDLYRKMITTYYIEERVKVFVRQGKCSFQASTRGHEKVQIGMTMLLKPRYDWFFTYYREKAIAVGLGMPIKDIFLGMLSRAGDPNSDGRNMPEHFSSRELNLVSMTACTGTQFLPAVGLAKSLKMDGSDALVYVSSGEGATSQGEFFEALNWAARERLPVLFVIQNNGYAISVPQKKQTISEIHRIARGFGMPTFDLDGTWFEPMYQTIPPVVERIRAGRGPALIEAQVVRIDPHSSSDDQKKYRTEEELKDLVERDPILQTEKYLLKNKIQMEEELQTLRHEIQTLVNVAADEADQAPPPDPSRVLAHIYSEHPVATQETPPMYINDEPINMVNAINKGLHEEMALNPKMVMWGEDIADPKGGVFGVTRGLTTAYPGRVENSALAEASIVGIAGGMALNGYKPIVEIQFADYSWPAYMQIRNEIATIRWRSNNEWNCPVVIRIACGGYIKGGPWHSTNIEALYSHTPGWYVVYPSCAEDAKGLIKTAARSEDPIIFLEHKGLYRRVHAKTREPNADYLIPLGKGRIRREGTDFTIVTWGSTVYMALDIAKELESQNISAEVIDLRSIVPLDEDLVYSSVRKTNRVIVAHEDTLTMGFGAEVTARISENCFEELDAPIIRVGAKDCFVPSAPNLENAVLPSLDDLRAAVSRLFSF